MRLVFFVAFVTLTAAHLWLGWKNLRAGERVLEARTAVSRLAKLTLEVFERRSPPQGQAFWKAIGRDAPILDPWGQEYRMEIFSGESSRQFIWISAGPDGRFGNRDDLRAQVPYQDGATLDLTPLSPEGAQGEDTTSAH